MRKHVQHLPANIEVIPAVAGQRPVLENLLQLYAYDFSEFHELDLGTDGRFVYKDLPLYWSDLRRHPFLVKIAGKWGGFVLVKKGSEISRKKTVWDIAEFFVIRRHRRKGIGSAVAHEVWRRFPGMWEVRVMEANRAGLKFWARSIAAFVGHKIDPVRIEKDGEAWHVFSFEARSRG